MIGEAMADDDADEEFPAGQRTPEPELAPICIRSISMGTVLSLFVHVCEACICTQCNFLACQEIASDGEKTAGTPEAKAMDAMKAKMPRPMKASKKDQKRALDLSRLSTRCE